MGALSSAQAAYTKSIRECSKSNADQLHACNKSKQKATMKHKRNWNQKNWILGDKAFSQNSFTMVHLEKWLSDRILWRTWSEGMTQNLDHRSSKQVCLTRVSCHRNWQEGAGHKGTSTWRYTMPTPTTCFLQRKQDFVEVHKHWAQTLLTHYQRPEASKCLAAFLFR